MKQKYYIPYLCVALTIVGDFFARRNEPRYLRKRNYCSESLPLKPFLRSYLPAFLWGDLAAVALTGTFLWLSAQFPVIARHDRAAFIVAALLIFTALDRLWKQQRIYRMFGWRSYPDGMLVISTITLMATPFLCLVGECGGGGASGSGRMLFAR